MARSALVVDRQASRSVKTRSSGMAKFAIAASIRARSGSKMPAISASGCSATCAQQVAHVHVVEADPEDAVFRHHSQSHSASVRRPAGSPTTHPLRMLRRSGILVQRSWINARVRLKGAAPRDGGISLKAFLSALKPCMEPRCDKRINLFGTRPRQMLLLKLSSIQGVGVFTTQAIPSGEQLRLWQPDDWRFLTFAEAESDPDFREVGKTYCVSDAGGYWCPLDFHRMSIGYYMNHSDAPNVHTSKDLVQGGRRHAAAGLPRRPPCGRHRGQLQDAPARFGAGPLRGRQPSRDLGD